MFNPSLRCTAFSGVTRIASGELRHVAMKAKQAHDAHPGRLLRVFGDAGAALIELPLDLPAAELLRLIEQSEPSAEGVAAARPRRRPGRPRLGVVPREVTLLPQHWDWLSVQPGGASLALRRLIDAARLADPSLDRRHAAQEATYRFLDTLSDCGPAFGDIARALYAGEAGRFESLLQRWPEDVREHALWLATNAFAA